MWLKSNPESSGIILVDFPGWRMPLRPGGAQSRAEEDAEVYCSGVPSPAVNFDFWISSGKESKIVWVQ